jgi:6-methylsalicylate decarboxylase
MKRYDVHAHFAVGSGPADRAVDRQARQEGFAGSAPMTEWSPGKAIAFMDAHGIAMQLLSLPVPTDPEQARAANERGTQIVAADPNRFGLLASLPMASPDQAVEEVRYAADVLTADGFVLMTNYEGAYLGDERFEPVFAELNRRKATVFVHPATPPAFGQLGLGRPGPLIEFPMDTARTIVDAVFAGLFLHHPNLRVVLAHAGGVLPALSQRILSLGVKPWVANPRQLTREQLRAQLASLYFDTAIAGTPATLLPAIDVAGPAHLVFGTDFPPAGPDVIDATIDSLQTSLIARDQKQMEATFSELFPVAAGRADN